MMITQDNYEAYLLDYLEGNLNEQLVDEFIEFLEGHPELQKEIDQYKQYTLQPEQVNYLPKNNLYKEKFDVDEEFDLAASAYIDGELSEFEKEEFESYLKSHPKKKKEVLKLKLTFLSPSSDIKYSGKKKLHKKSSPSKIIYFTTRVAAILILILGITSLLNQNTIIDTPESKLVFAEKEKQTKAKLPDPIPPKKIKKKITKKQKSPNPPIKTKPKKSIREKTRGRVDENKVATTRNKNTLSFLNTKLANIEISQPEIILADMSHLIYIEIENYPSERELLATRIKNKIGLKNFRFSDITKAGLNFASNISNKKFNYGTNQDGEITSYTLDTKLLGFHIPDPNNNQ